MIEKCKARDGHIKVKVIAKADKELWVLVPILVTCFKHLSTILWTLSNHQRYMDIILKSFFYIWITSGLISSIYGNLQAPIVIKGWMASNQFPLRLASNCLSICFVWLMKDYYYMKSFFLTSITFKHREKSYEMQHIVNGINWSNKSIHPFLVPPVYIMNQSIDWTIQ